MISTAQSISSAFQHSRFFSKHFLSKSPRVRNEATPSEVAAVFTVDEILTEHVVDIHRIEADFRDAFERNQASSSQTFGFNKYFFS